MLSVVKNNLDKMDKRSAPPVYVETVEVASGDVDYKREIKFSAMQKIFQEVASNHCRILKIGFVDLLPHNLLWVISRVNSQFIRRPHLFEKLVVRTWPLAPSKTSIEREFEVEDADGNIIVTATSKWCLIDKDTRKPVLYNSFEHNEPKYIDRHACDYTFPDYFGQKLEEQKGITSSRFVRLSDLDLNGHMNNTIYVDLIFDVLSKEEYDKNVVEGLYIKYKKEAKFGNNIVIRKYLIRDLICVKGFVDENEIFEAVVDLLTPEEAEAKHIKLGVLSESKSKGI